MDPDESQQVLSKKKLRELVTQIHPNERMDPDVEGVLLDLADDFIQRVTKASCQLAKHRQSDTLEVKDLQVYLESMYNIRIPGFGGDDVRPVRKASVPATHQQRLNQVKKAVNLDTMEKEKERLRTRK